MKYIFIILLFSGVTEAATKSVMKKNKSFNYQLGFGLSLSQETIKGTQNGNSVVVPTQSIGTQLNFSLVTKSKIWNQIYSIGVGYGDIKGGTDDGSLSSQSWLAGLAKAGLLYRTTEVSQIGLIAPLMYRMIDWKPKNNYEMERSNSFSAGVGGLFTLQLTENSILEISITHQQMWNSTVWEAEWGLTL